MTATIATWLHEIGLGQYLATFTENEIDFHILPDLTDADLKEMGITALGHRKKILKSISQLDTDKIAAAGNRGAMADSGADDDEDITAWSRTPGERKPVTMLFCDIVGSTAATENLDPEEAHERLYGVTELMAQWVENNNGTVCRFMGDGIMAMFGAPIASERHAVEACKAALEMQAQVQRHSKRLEQAHGSGVQIRIGLHSGEVVVLEVGDDPGKPEYDASGPTVAMAARMEQSAEAGTVLITQKTRDLAGKWITTEAQEPILVKGVSEPVKIYRLDQVQTSLQPPAAAAARPIVGRVSEMAQFGGLIQACLDSGLGQSVLIRGEPGIGKTRLVEEMITIAADSGFDTHMALVLDFGTARGQEAIPSLVRSFLNIKPGSGKSKRGQAIENAEQQGKTRGEHRVYLNDLLDLPQPLELRTLYDAMDLRARVDGKHRTVAHIVTRLAAHRPLLLVIEGLHWVDPETLDYLRYLTATVAECRTLMILTSRLEDDPIDIAWRARAGEHPTVTWDLGPLRNEESLKLATDLVGETDDFVEQCIERAEGNPLFLEQLLMVAERGNIDSVPDSIKSLVLARIDQLSGADKVALRAASVLGQRFGLDSLCHLIGQPDYDFRHLVEHLLVRPDGQGYMFTHALIQGGIYASLVRNQRSELHRRAATWFGDRDYSLHAEHLDRAGDIAAADAYLRAAQKQAELYRPERALQLVRRGLEIAPAAESFALRCLEGELLRIHGDIAESVAAYRGAAEAAAGDVGRCQAWIGVAEGLAAGGAQREPLEVLEAAKEIASEHRLQLELARIYRILGGILFYRGQIEACLEANQSSLENARAAASPEVEAHALSGLANAEYNRGRFISAHHYFDRCIELAREHGFGRVIAANLSMRSYVTCWQNDIEAAIAGYRDAAEQAAQINDPRAEMLALMIGGSFHALVGDIAEGEQWLDKSLGIIRHMGSRLFEGVCFYLLGRFALLRGERGEARRLTAEGIAILRESESGMTFGGPIALGILALSAEDADQCHGALREAEALLEAGSVGHNYLNFYEDAMEACLHIGDWDEAERYAQALQDYTRAEPLPRSDFFIARGRALAACGRGECDADIAGQLQSLQTQAQETGLKLALPAIETALDAARAAG